jgi:tetratricopeptide (TPR) repeat protein
MTHQSGQKQEGQLSRADKIGIAGLVVAVLAIAISVATPEIRCGLHLQSVSCPESIADKAENFFQKGLGLLKLGRYVEALDSFNQAIELDPQQAKAWNGRGVSLEKLGKNQQALASYEKALLLDSDYEIARQNREELLLKQMK